jgi:hypothetical protein
VRIGERGADLLGVAGGDGTQALVAGIAAEHDVPFLCISAGTRDHFAMDLGLDCDDPSTCLDALSDGVEERIDLGLIGDRTFVNNASFGAYAEIVRRPEYRDDKLGTTLEMLPDLLNSDKSTNGHHSYAPGAEVDLTDAGRPGESGRLGLAAQPRDRSGLGLAGMRNGREPMALRHGRAGARRAGPSGRTCRPCPGECPGPGRRRRTLCLRDGSSCRMTRGRGDGSRG